MSVLPSSLIVSRQLARFTASHSSRRSLRVRRLPRRSRGVSELYFSLRFSSNIQLEHPISCKIIPVKLFRINACLPRSSWQVSPFRINTCRTVSKQRVLTTFRMNTYEKQGEGGAVIVNQTPDEGCLSRATIGNRGISPISDKDSIPREHRDDRRFRPCRKGPLFTPDDGNIPTLSGLSTSSGSPQ